MEQRARSRSQSKQATKQKTKELLKKLYDRFKVETKKSQFQKIRKINPQILYRKKLRIGAACLAVIVAGVLLSANKSNNTDKPQSLGVNSISGGSQTDDGKTDEVPEFKILYPKNKPDDFTAVTRKTPTGLLLHTYADNIDGIEIEVTQQQLPDSFKSAPFVELEKMAKNFQATDIIQIDEAFVYHGLDEKTRVQSLFTVISDTLISIRSAEKISDDQWAAYILALE